MQRPEDRPVAKRSAGYWPWIVVAFLLGQAVASGITVYLAVSDPTFATEPDYYRKALAWDDTAAERRAEQELGWTVQLDVGSLASPTHERLVRVVLLDRGGAPLAGAEIEAEVFHHARAADRHTLHFAPADGAYHAELRVERPGVWEFRLKICAAGHTASVRREVLVAPALGVRG